MRAPLPTPAPKRTQAHTAGPWRGMRDAVDPVSADPQLAKLLENVYPLDPARGGAVVGRAGFSELGAQLGSGVARTGQWIGQFTKIGGTEYTAAFVGGLMYTYDWGSSSWTAVALGGGVALDAMARIRCVTFADQLIVSDGVNTPFAWDGATFTKLTNCPVLYGPPVVSYGKLVGIKAAERSTLVWSEENDPTTGYEAGGYNNAWQLTQTSSEQLHALHATEGELYVARRSSITAIFGDLSDPDVRSSTTRDAVSQVLGTKSPDTFIELDDGRLVFVDERLHAHVVRPGAGASPVWEDFRETLRLFPTAEASRALACLHPELPLLLIGLSSAEAQHPDTWFVYSTSASEASQAQALAVWRGYSFATAGVVKDGDGVKRFAHLTGDGYAHLHGTPEGTVLTDAGEAIAHVVQPAPLGYSDRYESFWTRLELLFRTAASMSALSVAYETARGQSSPQTVTLAGAASYWDSMEWDSGMWSYAAVETHQAVGLRGLSRWISPIIRHDTLGEGFGLGHVRLESVAAPSSPRVP